MDTNDLSDQAYELIWQAAKIDDTLKSILGSTCSECENEDEYLKTVMEIIEEIEEETKDYLEEWGLEEMITVVQYRKHLKKLKLQVKEVIDAQDKNLRINKFNPYATKLCGKQS